MMTATMAEKRGTFEDEARVQPEPRGLKRWEAGRSIYVTVTTGLLLCWALLQLRHVPEIWTRQEQTVLKTINESQPGPAISFPAIATATEITYAPTTLGPSKTLVPLAFTPLPLGTIKPGGWLASELSNSAKGLAGHLHDFYGYVRDSPWYGGSTEYAPLNEGFPYWFNGIVPMAYGLPDSDPDAARLKSQIRHATSYVLDHQADDGWLGPETGGMRMLWARFPFLLGLTQLAEAEPSWEPAILPAIRRFVRLMHAMLSDGGRGYVYQGSHDSHSEFDYDWGRVRSADMMLTLQWILEKHPSDQDEVIWDCMRILYELGRMWENWYNEAVYIKDDLYRVPDNEVNDTNFAYEHAVNVGQGLKAPAVIHRFTKNASLLRTAADAVDWTFRFHGATSGTILGDERIDGLSPYSGSELCTAVETMFSLSYLYQALGNNSLADRAELAAFNALPTMITGDHWAHQYMAQPNQPYSKELKAPPFFNAQVFAQTFGLEPNYPCCTVNHHQGLPKFVSNSWVTIGETGLAHVLLSPSYVVHDDIRIQCDTNYPFGETLMYNIDALAPFNLFLRVPSWAGSSSSISVNGGVSRPVVPDPVTGLHAINVHPGKIVITYTPSASIQIQERANSSIAVTRGALLYALEIGSTNTSKTPRTFDKYDEMESTIPPEARDWVFLNTTAWNIAIDPATLKFRSVEIQSLPSQMWSPGGPPLSMTAMGCEIDWPSFLDSVPGAVPPPERRKCLSDPYEVNLVPYGSAKLHMAELPTIDLS